MISKIKNRAGWASIILGIIGMVAGAVVWAASSHSDIIREARADDAVIRTELKTEVKAEVKEVEKQFVSREKYAEDITRLDTRQQEIKEDVSEIKGLITDVHKTIQRARRVDFPRERNHGARAAATAGHAQ